MVCRSPAALLALALLPLTPRDTAAQQQKHEIILVGTVHEPTAKFREDTLIALLRRLKPDLILLELDPSFFDSTGALRERFRNVSLESRAALEYAESAGVTLRPFDIDGRNRFYQETDYFGREMRLNQEISRLHASGALGAEAKGLFDSLLLYAAARDTCAADVVGIMNAAACDRAVERKQHYAFKGFRRIIETTPALESFAQFWATADDFWTRRTAAMTDNILRHARDTQARRTVVLTGFEHRPSLRRALAERADAAGLVLVDP